MKSTFVGLLSVLVFWGCGNDVNVRYSGENSPVAKSPPKQKTADSHGPQEKIGTDTVTVEADGQSEAIPIEAPSDEWIVYPDGKPGKQEELTDTLDI